MATALEIRGDLEVLGRMLSGGAEYPFLMRRINWIILDDLQDGELAFDTGRKRLMFRHDNVLFHFFPDQVQSIPPRLDFSEPRNSQYISMI
jgi:hypothetical protein